MPTFFPTFMRNARSGMTLGLVAFSAGAALTASAQSDTSESKPDSSMFTRIPSDTDDWTHHFRIGAILGLNINAHFSMNGQFNIPGNNAANGIYDDGYVLHDQTGDSGGYTGYWGYNNASQYNATAQTLTFHSVNSYSATGSADENGGAFPGFDMAYGDDIWCWKRARVGWEVGFDLLPISVTDDHPLTATSVNESVYTYDVSNPQGIPLPQAPYQGGPTGGGHPIPDSYSSMITQTLSGGTETITGTRSLDVMFYALRLGPSLSWNVSTNVGLLLGAGPAVGIVSGDYKYDETITIPAGGFSAHNAGKFEATDLVYGGYVNATVMYHVEKHGDIYAGVQYMPMSDANFSNGGREARLNLAGALYFSVGINWPF